MADAFRSNLEPIEEGDLDLKKKFTEGGLVNDAGKEIAPVAPETNIERKEGAAEKEAAYSRILAKVQPADDKKTDEDLVAGDASHANQAIDAESKISKLVDLAMQKGVTHAVKVARHLDDNYTLDEFHDRLMAEELHDALLKKGLLKEL
jgi:hypothetical protein